ncbi:MAG: glutathione S-transferase family protein [Rhodobacteraceae bacterium]|nr:MAG: glutathione S-transferase family protein [Paracoccaceae bacterium]
MQLFSMPSSGNSYKVRLLLALLGRTVPITDVEAKTDALAQAKAEGRLPFGKAPVLILDDGTALAESNAILHHLGQGTRFIPVDPVSQAQMLSWMFWEQNTHEGVIAVRSALLCYPHRRAQATPERLADLLEAGIAILQIMETHLSGRDWLVGTAPSLADLSLYAYTHSAETRGGFDLSRFPAICAWLARVEELPGYVGLDD